MNERIKELMKEANKDIPLGKSFWPALEEFSEKFAELIVEECYETCKENLVNDAEAQAFGLTYNDAVGDCAIQIKNHFGIKE